MTLKTPVLFLIFNQPEITERVFQEIRKARPEKLFIAADGPRAGRPNESEECNRTRAIVEKVDWDCEVRVKLNDKNLGCKVAVSQAITWFFSMVNEGIILEYDCLPSPSFFVFCETALEKYRSSSQVFGIAGSNFQFGRTRGEGSYYFSKHTPIWGWATWRDRWQLWDGDLSTFPEFLKEGKIARHFQNQDVQDFYLEVFEEIHRGANRTTWAYPWNYTLLDHDGLFVVPNVNLVTNIGFSPHATHAKDETNPLAGIPWGHLGVIQHPESVVADIEADEFFILKFSHLSGLRGFKRQIKRRIKRWMPLSYRKLLTRIRSS